VGAASQAIAKLEPEAIARALPSLRSALTTLGAYDTIQVIKQSDPQFLVVALKTPQHDAAAHDAADALGDLGAEARFALPALYEAIEGNSGSVRLAIESAIQRIDPNAPKLVFNFEDILSAHRALQAAADTAGGELKRHFVNVYEKDVLDQTGYRNYMTRSEVITIAQAVREVDQRAYNLFVAKLVEDNPSLADALKPAE